MIKIPVTTPFFDNRESEAVARVLESGWVAQGPVVDKFEKAVAGHEGAGYGVATSSCTTALHLAMTAAGMGAGMDVIVPAFTFVATANAVIQTGAVPILADVSRESYNVEPKDIRRIIEERYEERDGRLVNEETGNLLWGIVPVHQFGLCCDIYEINKIASRYHLNVIEDSACALGAGIEGVNQGGFGNVSCVSFHPRKSITSGEGGMILANDEGFARRLKELRTHGSAVSAEAREKGRGFLLPEFREAGYNYRMTDIQGAVGLVQMEKLDYIIQEKRRSGAIYDRLIGEMLPELILPYVPDRYFHTYQSYVCMLDCRKLGLDSAAAGGEFRNRLLEQLEDKGIATRQGTHAIHLLGYYRERFGYKPEDYPNAYACDRLSIALPMYVGIGSGNQEYVIRAIRELLDNR